MLEPPFSPDVRAAHVRTRTHTYTRGKKSPCHHCTSLTNYLANLSGWFKKKKGLGCDFILNLKLKLTSFTEMKME